jgi:CDP-paratose synthetase
MKKVLLTGGAGFIGSHLLRQLLIEGFDVIVVKKSSTDIARIQEFTGDVQIYDLDKKSLSSIFLENEIDAVVHLACKYGRESGAKEVVEANVNFGLDLLDLAVASGVRLFLNTDTFYNVPGKRVEGKLAPYILTKRHFVDWLIYSSKNISVINLKLQHVYGSDDNTEKFLPWLVRQFSSNNAQVDLTGGEQQRDFVSVSDVASAFCFCLKYFSHSNSGFHEFMVGSEHRITLREFVVLVHKTYRKEKGGEATKLNFGALPYAADETMVLDDLTPSLTSLGWSPSSNFDEAIREMVLKNGEGLHV